MQTDPHSNLPPEKIFLFILLHLKQIHQLIYITLFSTLLCKITDRKTE